MLKSPAEIPTPPAAAPATTNIVKTLKNITTMTNNIKPFITRAALTLALAMLTAATAWAETTKSTITVGSTDYTLFTGFTATGGNGTNYAKLVDGNTSTDWSATKNYDDPNEPANDFAGGTDDPAFVEFHADEPIVPKGYVLTCDRENAGFWKPVEWALKARLNESDTWTTIHSSNTTLGAGKTFEIACDNDDNNEYQYFRFEVYEVGTTMTVDLDELQFYGLLPAYTHLTVKAATCMATGIKQDCYRRNSDGKYFTDNTGETEIPESDVIAPIIPHTGEHHEATDVNIEYWQCSMCGKYFSDEGYTTEITEEQTKIYRTITIDGSISSLVTSNTSQALAGTTMYLYVSDLIDASTLKVNDGAVELTAVTDIQYTFTMPAADVTVTAEVAQSNADGDILTGSIRHTVTIPDGASITLNNAAISGSIVCEGTATITLVGTNSVSGATFKAGIQIGGSGTTLTIKGDGSLTANGGSQSAGIGLSRIWNYDSNFTSGDIVIEGGTITATGGKWGAGIGTGVIKNTNNDNSTSVQFGKVTIKGGTVTATGGDSGDGIGKGYSYPGPAITFGTVTIYDGIDKVDASSIKDFASVVYMHGETDVTASKTDYFAIGEDGNRRLIVQKPVIAEIAEQAYTGSEITPEPLVIAGSLSLTKGTDYTYSYENNTNVGTATVTVTFQGDYESLGSVEKEFNIVWSETDTDEYTIHNAAEWNVFCDCLNDNDTYNRFSGKTVRLGADITVTRMAGSGDNPFCGNFDGGGNTLTFTATAADNYCAPFVGVKGGTTADDATTIGNLNVVTTITANDYRHMAGLIALQWGHVNVSGCNATVNISSTVGTSNPSDLYPAALVSQASSSDGGTLTVTGCTASGTISTDGKYAAGLVGIVQGTASISDCVSSVTIDSSVSGDGTHGGIVAALSGVTNIYGTVFNGRLLGEDTESVGGFIGWRNKGANIYNSLFIPTDVTVKKANSATFARNDVDTHNCYYTYYLCDGEHYVPYYATDGITRRNGHAPRTVTPGADVTLAVALSGDETHYAVSGITAYAGGGIKRTEASADTYYYGQGDALSLNLGNTAAGAPAGYRYDTYTASGGSLAADGTLTMPDADVTISVSTAHLASTGQPVPVAYVDADGTLHDGDNAAQAVALDGSETSLGTNGQETWYFVGLENVNFDHGIGTAWTGTVNIILANGCTMNVGSSSSPIEDNGIWCGQSSLSIYGQSLAAATAGHLNIYTDGYAGIGSKDYNQYSGNVSISTDGSGSYCFYNFGDININGGTITANASGGHALYTYDGDININGGTVNVNDIAVDGNGTITLGWNKPTDRISITASSYYGTVQVASGKKLHNGSGFLGGTLGDPAADVNGKALRPAATATYTTADGNAATADAILLDGSDNSLPAGNYLATGTLNYTHGITLTGNVTLILADNCHMNVGTSGEGRIEGKGIDGPDPDTGGLHDLTITSESLGDNMGAINIYTTGSNNAGIRSGALTINGGNITADTNGKSAIALNAGGTLTINGGTVSATTAGTTAHAIAAAGNFNYNGGNVTATAPNANAIRADVGNYTFSWRTPADRITIGATGLYATAVKTATFTRLFTDATGNYYGATLTGTALNALKGVTLTGTTQLVLDDTKDNTARILAASGKTGLDVKLAARTLYKDGAWNTLCLPFAVDLTDENGPLYGATAKTLTDATMTGTHVTLTFSETPVTTLEAGKPYIIKWDGDGTDNIVEPVFTGVTVVSSSAADRTITKADGHVKFIGYYDPFTIDTPANDDIYYMTADNTLKHTGKQRTLKACRAYFQFSENIVNSAREFVLDFGDETTALTLVNSEQGIVNSGVYDLQGRKVSNPSKGLYIRNGKKVVIK